MLYFLAKLIMTPATAWYFRRKFFLGKERIPQNGPMVIIGTHSGSFLDAMVMGVMLRRPIYFYVRGDIFRKKIVRWIFTQLHMIPVFSADLAKQDLLRNSESFDIGSDILCNGGVLLIFPEGLSRLERNFMPFRKSPVRVILQALQKNESLSISVVPIGINYTKHSIRADLQLVTGKVIQINAQSIAQLIGEGTPSEAIRSSKALSLLTKEMRNIYEPIILYIHHPERYTLLNRMLLLLEAADPGMRKEKFEKQRFICKQVDALTDQEVNQIENFIKEYDACLRSAGISDRALYVKAELIVIAGLILSFPFYIFGFVINYIPYRFGKYIADTKVTREDFYTSVQMAVSAKFYLLWLLCWIIFGLLMNASGLVWIFIASPFLGWFSVHWRDHYNDYIMLFRSYTLKGSTLHKLYSNLEKICPDEAIMNINRLSKIKNQQIV